MKSSHLICDYLIIGAGASSLAFVDTLLTEQPSARVVLVDRHSAPGGQWNDAYDFVRLHQPSLLYGVASKQLEGNWLKLMLGGRTLPWKHRATKEEILAHYASLVKEWVSQGSVQYYPECSYNFHKRSNEGQDVVHRFESLDGTQKYTVDVEVKLVNGVLGECKVPSQHPPQFPIAKGVNVVTPNDLCKKYGKTKLKNHQKTRYVVMGAGKTAMDTVIYLQTTMKVSPDNIIWIIPNDVWMLNRDGQGGGGPWVYPRMLLACNGDTEKACALMNKEGNFVRIDDNVIPTRYRFPVVGGEELKLMRKVKNIVRRGRVSSILLPPGEEKIVIGFGSEQEPLQFSKEKDCDLIFVHCTSPGPFNGIDARELFVSESEMNLALLYAPPVPISMSCLAKLECARRDRTLDIEFGRKLLTAYNGGRSNPANEDAVPTENDVLKGLVLGLELGGGSTAHPDAAKSDPLDAIVTLAVFIALLDKDPMVGHKWLSQNRLSFFSIPGFKSNIHKDLMSMISKHKFLGFSEHKAEMLSLLSAKLEPLKGK